MSLFCGTLSSSHGVVLLFLSPSFSLHRSDEEVLLSDPSEDGDGAERTDDVSICVSLSRFLLLREKATCGRVEKYLSLLIIAIYPAGFRLQP